MPDGSWAILAVRERTEGEGQGYRLHRTVEEWDLDGKVVKQWSWQWYSATWLRNGNLLLRDYRLFEQDHKGKVLWEVFREKGFGNVQVCLGLVRLGFSDSRPPDADLNAVANRIKGLQSKDVLERRWSARELERLKTKAAPAAAALTKALEDPEDLVVGAAVDALQVIGPSAVPELLRTLKHNNPEVRWRAAWCLGAYPNEAKAITPALIAATKDEHAIVRGIAASMLGRMKTEAAKAVPVLIGLLRDSQANVRRRAALALGHLGPAAREAVPVLRELSGSGEHPVASHAVEALKLIQGEK
ncbi:MAG: HEAT repeat domain-containing protein [Gemmataceae bacterium]|nr:HEAT repeat domain-containing protein [Gemmataceae bacterium]